MKKTELQRTYNKNVAEKAKEIKDRIAKANSDVVFARECLDNAKAILDKPIIEPLDYAGTPYANIECVILDNSVNFNAIEGNNPRTQVNITKDEAIGMAKFILKSFNATF